MNDENKKKVTVYSCSGCSNVAQLANTVAVKLHRAGIAQMSCIAGVGGNVPSLVNAAKKAKKIIALDGCPLSCVANCLKQHAIMPDHHIVLTELGFTKNQRDEVSPEDSEKFYYDVANIIEKLKAD